MQESASPSGSSPGAAGTVRSEFQGVGEGGEASFKCIEKQADINGKVVRCVMGVLGAAISVQQLLTDTNTWTDLRSRVDLATCSQEKGAAVIQRLAAMAKRTYSGIEQTTEFWLANATALRELGLSTRESLDFTEALNNAMVVSGAKGERAASVQNALSKAMALGKLRPCFRTAGGGTALDVGLLAACQAVEHYEIARYGSLREWAKDLGHDDAHKLLSEILDQEKATNNKLTNLAVTAINKTTSAKKAA